jgi:hypothetical protein
MVFLSVRSASPYRITVTTDVSPDLTATNYVITRQDGASTAAYVSNAFKTGFNTVELTVAGEVLIDGVVYIISDPFASGSPSGVVSYRQPLNQSQVPVSPAEDPEAEAFGIDIDWFADSLTGSGDTPVVRGRQCLVNDLAVICLIQKGELFHRPDAGAGVKLSVNGPMGDREVKQVIGAVTREWYKDARVRQGGVDVRGNVDTSGRLTLTGTVLPVAIDDPTKVKLPGGGT